MTIISDAKITVQKVNLAKTESKKVRSNSCGPRQPIAITILGDITAIPALEFLMENSKGSSEGMRLRAMWSSVPSTFSIPVPPSSSRKTTPRFLLNMHNLSFRSSGWSLPPAASWPPGHYSDCVLGGVLLSLICILSINSNISSSSSQYGDSVVGTK